MINGMWLSWMLACTGEVAHHPDPDTDSAVAEFAISALDPDAGPAAGGTFVRISGNGFTTATEVAVGEEPCAETTFLSSVEIFCTTPPGSAGEVALTVSEGGESAGLPFTYLADDPDTADTGEPPPEVTGCLLEAPLSVTDEEFSYPSGVMGSVTVPGRTGFEAFPLGVEAEAGWGMAADDPSLWSWAEMSHVGPVGEASQFTGSLALRDRGNFAFSVRFRVDHGEWSVCRSASGELGSLTVIPDNVEEPVDYCHLQWPCAVSAPAGTTSPDVYAWIYQGGVTTAPGAGVGVLFELGVGEANTDPDTHGSWAWSPMEYFADKDGLIVGDYANDEYVGNFEVPGAAGTYDYTARASADDGLTWTLCDLGGDSCNLGGSSDGYDDPGECVAE